MSMWVCRAGENSVYYDVFKEKNTIFLAWKGFDVDLFTFTDKEELRAFVIKEKKIDNRTSISNWVGQLLSFYKEMLYNEYVLVPSKGSRFYSLARIAGDYEYRKYADSILYHSRSVEFLRHDIPREIFDQDIVYSLGAYRTLFKVKHEQRVLDTIEHYKCKE